MSGRIGKRIIALMLAVVLAVSLFPAPAMAADDVGEGGGAPVTEDPPEPTATPEPEPTATPEPDPVSALRFRIDSDEYFSLILGGSFAAEDAKLSLRRLYAGEEGSLQDKLKETLEHDLAAFGGVRLVDAEGADHNLEQAGMSFTVSGRWLPESDAPIFLLADPYGNIRFVTAEKIVPEDGNPVYYQFSADAFCTLLWVVEGEPIVQTEEYPPLEYHTVVDGMAVDIDAPEGAFPAGTTVTVRSVETEAVMDAVEAAVEESVRDGAEDVVETQVVMIRALDITFYNAEQQEIQPLLPISVNLRPMEAEEEHHDVAVVHIDEEGVGTAVEDVERAGEEVSFSAESFSTYVYTSVLVTRVLDSRGDTWKVTLTYNSHAQLPEGAELSVTEIPADSEDYAEYAARAAAALQARQQEAGQIRLFDISLRKDGQEAQPHDLVSVAVELDDWADKKMAVVHLGAEEEILSSDCKAGTVSFATGGFSVYAIVEKQLDTTFIASDGAAYDIQVTYDELSGIPMEGTALLVSEILPGDAGYEEYIAASAEKLGMAAEDVRFSRVFDISIVADDDPGHAYEPTGDVSVSIRLKDTALDGCDKVDVLHFAESGGPDRSAGAASPEPVEIKAAVTDEAVKFTTDSFSVYVVIGHENGTVVTPRVKFHFIEPHTGDVSGTVDNGSGGTTAYYADAPYEFRNMGEDNSVDPPGNYIQTTQILRDGESLELIEDPENQNSRFFYGWYVVDPMVIDGTTDEYGIGTADGKLYYSWTDDPQLITFESPISIEGSDIAVGDTVNWSLDGVSGSGAVDGDGNVHVFLAPLYEKYFFVDFMLYPRNAASSTSTSYEMTRKMVAVGNADSVDVKISDVRSNSTDSKHLIFVGWEYNAGTEQAPNWVQFSTVDYSGEEIEQYVTVAWDSLDDSREIDMYPIFVEARWVNFVSGITGSGATYVASRFLESWSPVTPEGTVETADVNVFTTLETPVRAGYQFGGWYAFAVTDPDTGEITNLSSPEDVSVSYVQGSNDNYTPNTVTINTQAIQITGADGSIVYDGTYSLDTGSGSVTLFSAADGKLKLHSSLDQLTLYAQWIPEASKVTVVYWTENVQDVGYTAPAAGHEKDDYTASAVKTITTGELNAYYESANVPTRVYSGSVLCLEDLAAYQDASGPILEREYLDDISAVPAGEEIFYDRNDTLSDSSVVINGDGSTTYNVYFERKTFKLVFHIGRDGYVKEGGPQRPEYMEMPAYSNWDGNWIQFMYKDYIVNTVLGYTPSPGGISYAGVFTMTYLPTGETYDSTYVTTPANVLGNYVPAEDEANLYVITAKYGAFIGDRWPTPVNSNFAFSDPPGAKLTMYIWAGFYSSRYCWIAQNRPTWGGQQGNNPDINGIYNYMSAELCSDRSGTALINAEQVHHLVAYFGPANNANRVKHYHIMYEAVDGTYDPAAVELLSGDDFASYTRTTWSSDIAHVTSSVIEGRSYYEKETTQVISNVDPQFQLVSDIDGYELVYSCYHVPAQYDNHVYFFFRPRQYTLTFKFEDEADVKTDTYYYGQSLADACKYDPPEKTGHYFAGWYTNEAGVGEPFDFAGATMPSSNEVLYPILKILQYRVEIDPNGGVIDHIDYGQANGYGVSGSGHNVSQATYFTANYGTPVGEYTIHRNYVLISDKELEPGSATYYEGTKYYYVNTQFNEATDGDWGLPPDLRNAVYLDETQLHNYYDYYVATVTATANAEYYTGVTLLTPFEQFAAAYTSYPDQAYRPVSDEHYTFMGWYKVLDNGSTESMPYNFHDPVMATLKLRALWRLDDGYIIQYNPYYLADGEQGGSPLILGETEPWTDPADYASLLYADQTPTEILRAPTNDIPGWVFRGWRAVRRDESSAVTVDGRTYYNWIPIQLDGNGDPIYYQPGESFTVDSALVTEHPESGIGSIIHMQAYYEQEEQSHRRPEVTNLILDANDEYGGFVNTTNSESLPALSGPGSSCINTESELDTNSNPTQILFGDFQSNLELHLYRYATANTYNGVTGTNFFSNVDNYLLLGFDENSDPASPTTGMAYIPMYAPDSVAAVTRNDQVTLYALWEPMVYVTFVNTTDENITVDLSDTDAGIVSIVNLVTGEFDREQAALQIVIPAKSGDTNGEVKIVLPDAEPGVDSFTAAALNDHFHKKMSVSGEFPAGTDYGTGSENVLCGETAVYTGTLQAGPEGIIVTYTEEPDLMVTYDVNGGVWTETSDAFVHMDGDQYIIREADITDNAYRPADPTMTGMVFLGWTTNPDVAAHTDFSSTDPVTWGDTVITPDEGSNVLKKIKSDYLWDFSQDPPFDQTLYAVWSESVTVSFNMYYRESYNTYHIWTGPETTDQPGSYVFFHSSNNPGYVTFTMAKGDRVPKPDDPAPNAEFTAAWSFIKWLNANNTTDRYRYNTINPYHTIVLNNAFDFSQPVTEDVTLNTSWSTFHHEDFTFTVENHVVNGTDDDEFTYTVAISNEWVDKRGSMKEVAPPESEPWGLASVTLKNGQQYIVHITVTAGLVGSQVNYSVVMDVVDQDGRVIKSEPLLRYYDLQNKYFTSSYRYDLTITQDAKDRFDTTVAVEHVDPAGSIAYDTPDDYSFAFSVQQGPQYADNQVNEYVEDADNSLDVVFTNTRTLSTLTVTKTITGEFANYANAFEFTVSGLTAGGSFEWTRTMTDGSAWAPADGVADAAAGTCTADAEGKITFSLRHLEAIDLVLPAGTEVTVSEESGLYTASYCLDDAAAADGSSTDPITMNRDHTVAFTNSLSSVVETGIFIDDLPFAVLTASALLIGALLFLWKKRRRKAEP
ncbi:MAG: InlB B-repeat-containing protein [Oscillospiraceae bacterium]|nr:InlB B-repeat-containing protein [Oscillospiraceae bacterium]